MNLSQAPEVFAEFETSSDLSSFSRSADACVEPRRHGPKTSRWLPATLRRCSARQRPSAFCSVSPEAFAGCFTRRMASFSTSQAKNVPESAANSRHLATWPMQMAEPNTQKAN